MSTPAPSPQEQGELVPQQAPSPRNQTVDLILAAAKAQPQIALKNITSQSSTGLALAQKTPHFWLTNFVLTALLGGLFTTTLFNTVAAAVSDFASSSLTSLLGYYAYGLDFYEPSFGSLLMVVLIFAIGIFAIQALVAATIMLASGGSQKYLTFQQAATLLASSNTPALLVLAVFWLLAFIPSFIPLIFFISLFLVPFLSLLLYIQIYVGLNQNVQYTKSPAVRYVLCTMLASVGSSVIWYATLNALPL